MLQDMLRKMLRKKKIGHYHDSSLHRTLSAFDLTLMGIGAIIGAGVFVLTGVAAATKAGPAVILSFTIAGMAAMFAALAYAELASSVGGSGSAYSYSYAGFGEFIGWLVGWNLILEYAMSVSTVAIGWSGYVVNFFEAVNIHLPHSITSGPFEGGVVNLLAMFIILSLSGLLCLGVRQSARFNAVVVYIKLLTIAAFIVVAIPNVQPSNWVPFVPFGWSGVMEGAALVFFAYIGFDALSTAVEETVNPQRDIPIAIIASLIGCTLIYILVAALLTGIVSYTTLNVGSPVAEALLNIGHRTMAGLTAAGAIAGLTTVMLVMSYGLTRICLVISRDGLIPPAFAKINQRTHTPIRAILISGAVMALVSGFVPIGRAAELVNIGTLTAFSFVCIGVVVLRATHPEMARPFKLPLNPVIPFLGVAFSVYLMTQLSEVTWWRFFIWTAIGIGIYFLYSHRNSALEKTPENAA
jgi:APA family basic amino acid/polyamine antiporter